MIFAAAAAIALLPLALASPQGYGPPASSAPAYSAPAASGASSAPAATASGSSNSSGSASSGQILVTVGAGGNFVFQPSDIQAPVGTLVTFVFPSDLAHSVTQSSFDAPCTPLENGFDSGLQTSKTFSVNVTDASTPVYFFCKAPLHCGSGMVGSINAPSSGNGSNSALVSAATAIGNNEKTIPDAGPKTGGVGAVATAGPQTGTPTVSGAAATGTSPSGSGSSSGAAPSDTNSPGGGSSGAASVGVNTGLAALGVVAAAFALAL